MAPSAIKGSHVNIQPRLVSIAHASRLTCLGKASCLTTQAHATGRTMACVVALVTFDDLTLSLSMLDSLLEVVGLALVLDLPLGRFPPPHTHWMAHGGPVRSCFVKVFPERLPPAKPPLRIAFGTALGDCRTQDVLYHGCPLSTKSYNVGPTPKVSGRPESKH
jgi:hypothetical protein